MVSNYFFTSSTALLCGLLASSGSIIPTANGALLPRQVLSPDTTNIAPSNVPTLTATSVSVPTAAFGSFIEGAAVDADGNLFAADFRAGNLTPSSSYGYFFERQVGTTNVLDLSQNPIFNAAAGDIGDTAENPPLIAGARFLRDGSLLVTDAANQRVLQVEGPFLNGTKTKASTFCSNFLMNQPNDLALSVTNPDIIYLSGQNFSADTTAGLSGDLWTCIGNRTLQFSQQILAIANIHRTNGIETSPNGQFLYLSSAENSGGAVISNRIFRFGLNEDGTLKNAVPELFFDFTGAEAAIDIDGMRTDTEGNLFVTRNGAGRVVKLSPDGQLLLNIELEGNAGPSNLEFGSFEGSTLFAIGRCLDSASIGCANSIELNSVGKAFANLQNDYF